MERKTCTECKETAERHKPTGEPIHFGRLHGICFEKFSELAPDVRIYKGRVVFGGQEIRQAEGLQVLFNDGGSGAPFISSSKVVDGVLLMPGCDGEQADALMAYTQAPIEGTSAWVSLPKHAWPDWWHDLGYDDPVCPLQLSFYGHPMAGVHWERHCYKHLERVGFRPIPGWECLFIHCDPQVVLSVYVDDLKLAGPKQNIQKLGT